MLTDFSLPLVARTTQTYYLDIKIPLVLVNNVVYHADLFVFIYDKIDAREKGVLILGPVIIVILSFRLK